MKLFHLFPVIICCATCPFQLYLSVYKFVCTYTLIRICKCPQNIISFLYTIYLIIVKTLLKNVILITHTLRSNIKVSGTGTSEFDFVCYSCHFSHNSFVVCADCIGFKSQMLNGSDKGHVSFSVTHVGVTRQNHTGKSRDLQEDQYLALIRSLTPQKGFRALQDSQVKACVCSLSKAGGWGWGLVARQMLYCLFE